MKKSINQKLCNLSQMQKLVWDHVIWTGHQIEEICIKFEYFGFSVFKVFLILGHLQGIQKVA